MIITIVLLVTVIVELSLCLLGFVMENRSLRASDKMRAMMHDFSFRKLGDVQEATDIRQSLADECARHANSTQSHAGYRGVEWVAKAAGLLLLASEHLKNLPATSWEKKA